MKTMNNFFILKNTSNYLSVKSCWSNYKFFNKSCKTYDQDVFFCYKFINNFTCHELVVTAFQTKNNTFDFKYNNTSFKIVETLSDNVYSLDIGKNYNNYDSFVNRKINTKYDLIISLKSSIFIVYFCCRKTSNSKKLWDFKGNLQRNMIFKYESDYYRVGKIEEYTRKDCKFGKRNVKDEKLFPKVRFNKNTMDYNSLDSLTIIFDLETMTFNDRHYPYMIYAKTTNFNWPLLNKQEPLKIDLEDKQLVTETCLNLNLDFDHHNSCKEDEFYDAEYFFDHLPESNIIDNFIEWVFQLIYKHVEQVQDDFSVRIIGFNNNRFDNNFLLDKLRRKNRFTLNYSQRFNKVSQIMGNYNYKNHNIKIFIDDLIKFLPETTLSKACKDYNIQNAKIDFDIVKFNKMCTNKRQIIQHVENIMDFIPDPQYKNRTDVFEIIKHYCIMDVCSTEELYLKITSLLVKLIFTLARFGIVIKNLNFMRFISIPQLAFNIFLETARLSKFSLGRTIDIMQNDFIICSCIGGRVNYGILGEYYSSNIKYMDVTSEYPLSMTAPYPSFKKDPIINPDIGPLNKTIQEIIKLRNEHFSRQDYETCTYFEQLFCGIFRVNIIPPSNESDLIVWAPVPLKLDGRNQFKNVAQEGRILNTAHIRTCIYAGWNVEIVVDAYNILFTSTEYIFKPFINLIGTMKTHYTPINKSFARVCKLIMNSVSGKLAQKVTTTYYKQETKCNDMNGFQITDNSLEQITDYSTSLHYLSSFVTGYANWILFSTAYKLNKYSNKKSLSDRAGLLLYSDTDSLVYDANKTTYNNFVISEQLGSWNESKCDFDITWKEEHPNEIKKLVVLARKSYALFNENNEFIDIKLKGIPSKQMKIFDYQTLKILCCKNFRKKTIKFDGLRKQQYSKVRDIIQKISDAELIKTLALEKKFTILKSNESNQYNINNLNETFNEDFQCFNYLVFTQADLE